MLSRLLNVGMSGYCGISDSKVEILYDTLDSRPEIFDRLLTKAYHLGLDYDNDMQSKQLLRN